MVRCRPTKQTADIDLAFFQAAKADVAVEQKVHFQVGGEGDVTGMDFEAEPPPAVFLRLQTAAIGLHEPSAKTIVAPALIFAQRAAAPPEMLGQQRVHGEPR